MIFVPRRESSPYFDIGLEESAKQFMPEYYDFKHLQGLLVLENELSMAVEIDGQPTYGDVKKTLVFGVPTAFKSSLGPMWTVLPGAPMAFVKWNSIKDQDTSELRFAAQGIDDMDEFEQVVNGKGGGEKFEIHPSVIKAIHEYYGKHEEGKMVKSFRSYPLVDVKGSRAAFGVLNVHCDQKQFLGGRGSNEEVGLRNETFGGIISPFIFDIAMVAQRYAELRYREDK